MNQEQERGAIAAAALLTMAAGGFGDSRPRPSTMLSRLDAAISDPDPDPERAKRVEKIKAQAEERRKQRRQKRLNSKGF